MPDSQFIYVCCQNGAEPAVKSEIGRTWPELRFAFSRPGFVTFKNMSRALADRVNLKSVFARTYGFSLGQVRGEDRPTMAEMACRAAAGHRFNQLHVWSRDPHAVGERGFFPAPGEVDDEIGILVRAEAVRAEILDAEIAPNQIARSDDRVLDIIRIDDQLWWVGHHRAHSNVLRQPGGLFRCSMPPHAVSRAYLKMDEALRWSRLPLQAGDRCVEIGSAPGGSCQALLDRGLFVTGIDPSEMHPSVLAHPRFQHIRKRGADLKRREYGGFRWLTIDTNVAPNHTLDTVEAIVTHRSVNIRGLVLTIKLPDWRLADRVPDHIRRVHSWGYSYVRARQLAYNRQEYCVVAWKSRSMRKPE
jgi:23S rRNA (cytidine2498-2'-O)-methyltransferase